ncbi:MAG: hypothetical protein KH158_10410 [Eggerthellaceae bacterium]|nr:hypothetical protein [Eggerthellaceae bacterium]
MDDLTYTDARWRDAGVVVAYELAMEHGPATRNSFALACPLSSRPAIEPRSLVYMEGTEFGGIVDEIGVEAKRPRRKRAVYRGRTWHGLLAGKIVCPDAGRTHYRIRGEANAALLALVHRVGLGDLFTASSANSGITLDHQVRFADAYTAALGALRASGAKLAVSWDGDRAVLSAAPAKDWSAADELDTDRLGFDMAKCYRPVNHLVCVGEGELTDRAEVHFFADAEGNVSQTQTLFGVDERAAKYDYTNADAETLAEEGRKKLEELQNEDTCDADVAEGYSYDVGDVVGAYDVDTGIFVSAPVVGKAATVDRHGARESYMIGEAARTSSLSATAESSGGGGRTYVAGANITIAGSTISADVGLADLAAVEDEAREARKDASNASAAAGRAQEAADGKAALEHVHDERYYTEAETDAMLAGKADAGHGHTRAQIADFPASLPASDVYAWAKAPSKPSYTAAEVGAAGSSHGHTTATAKTAGFLAAADKAKLDGVAENANAYVLPTAGAALGGVKTTSTVTSASGYTPTPIIGGVPYYKDTNTTYGIMTGATASAAGTAGLAPAPAKGAATRYLRSDGSWQTPPDTNTVYTHPTAPGSRHIPAGGASGQILRWSADGTAVWGADSNTTYGPMAGATGSAAGKAGLVPAPAAGGATRYLNAAGEWTVPPDTKYSHPATHPAAMIAQDATHRFATDAEKTAWSAKAPSDVATATKAGLVKPDGVTVKVASDGTLSAEQGGAASFLAAYPPQSLYWTESPTSPQAQYGGVWERREWPHGYLWARKS